MWSRIRRHRALVLALVATVAGGCSGQDGPQTYRVSGAVSFDGQPVPQGMIVFTPDLSQNDGIQGVAAIKDGMYDTSTGGGLGSVGGAMKVSVTGLTTDQKPLCQYDFALDLPKADTVKDIEIPKSAAAKATTFEQP